MYFPKNYDNNSIYINSGVLENIGSTPEQLTPIELCHNAEWMSRRFRVNSCSVQADGNVKVNINPYEWTLLKNNISSSKKSLLNNAYWFENHLLLLDEPGEWFYDQDTGTVYYYPMLDEDINTAIVEYPKLDALIQLEGTNEAPVSHIVFEGINFTGTTNNYATYHGHFGMLFNDYCEIDSSNEIVYGLRHKASINGKYANNIIIKKCKLYELGTSGICFREGCNNILIEGNAITNIAMSAIEVGEHNTKAPSQTWCRNIAIRSNYIENIGTDYFSSIGIMVTRIDTLNIEHNLLRHLPYSGITVGYGFNVDAGLIPVVSNIIRNNYIEDTMYALNDGGAIYTQGYITYRYNGDNIIENNYIKGNGSSREMSMGIYHDGSSSNWLVQNNVIDGYHRYPIFCQYHVQNQIASHINIINNYSTISPIKTEYQGGEERGLYFHNNTYYNDFSKLPESAIAIISNTGLLPEYRNIIDTDNGIAVKTYTTNLTLKPNAENELELIVSNCTNNQISGMFGLIFKKQIESDRGAYYIQSPEAPPDIKIIPESIQVTLMPNQKDVKVKFRITYELENNQSYNPSSYLVDLKLYANNGRVYSFPRITNLYMPSVFNDIPEVAFNESGNLFSNGSCSTSEGWAFWNPGTNNSVGYDEVDGNRCIKFTVSSFPSTRSTMYFTQNNISLKSNKKYRISFYMKASKEVKYIDNTQKILIRFYNNDNTDFTQNGKYIDFVCTDVNTLSEGEWYRIVGFMSTEGFNIPENSQFKIRFFIGGGSKTAEIVNLYFDNIITTEIE